jgi:hypothetical protein
VSVFVFDIIYIHVCCVIFFLASGSYCPEYDEVPFSVSTWDLHSSQVGCLLLSYTTKGCCVEKFGLRERKLSAFFYKKTNKREYVYCHLYIYIYYFYITINKKYKNKYHSWLLTVHQVFSGKVAKSTHYLILIGLILTIVLYTLKTSVLYTVVIILI